MKDATELHYGKCRIQPILGTKSEDISASAASILTFFYNLYLMSRTTLCKCNAKSMEKPFNETSECV